MHIAIIPDGNRRWARKLGLSVEKGHEKGIRKMFDVIDWAYEKGINELTVWGFSTENINRPKEEVNNLMHLFANYISNSDELLKKAKEKGIKVRFFGNLNLFPKIIKEGVKRLEDETKRFNKMTLNVLIGYGGKNEIAEAIVKANRSKKKVTLKNAKSFLPTSEVSDVDLVIRTSGEQRLSGLLPWQVAYAELYFVKHYWPEFTKRDFEKAIEEYNRRQRRFGR